MSYYDTMQVCKKWGHQITAFYDSSPKRRKKYCDKCGSETTMQCGKCLIGIRGHYYQDNVINLSGTPIPYNCHDCGNPYPWKRWFILRDIFKNLASPIKYIFDSIIRLFKK